VDLDAGMPPPEAGEPGREEVLVQGRQRAEAEPAPLQTRHLLDHAPGLRLLGQDPLREREQRLPRIRQGEPPAPAVEQRRAQLRLQPLDLERERRLGDVQLLRGPAEVQPARRRDEVAKLVDLHRYRLSI
jgi:hypothetical protein